MQYAKNVVCYIVHNASIDRIKELDVDTLYSNLYNKGTNKQGRYKDMKVKEIKTMQVVFNFGSVATISVKIYEGKTLDECVRLRSENIDGYILNNKYVAIA